MTDPASRAPPRPGYAPPAADAHGWARELEIAREIQRGFLPAELPRFPGWELAAAFAPARQVSGDFYDAFPLGGGLRLGVVLGEVCRRGVASALFMALLRSLVRVVATRVVHSGHTVTGDHDSPLFGAFAVANDYIAEVHGGAGMWATACAVSVDLVTGRVRWVNAGHEPAPVLVDAGGVRLRLGPTGPALGLEVGARHEPGGARLRPGEFLLAATDGVTQARAPDGAAFGADRLAALCHPAPDGPGAARALSDRVRAAALAFAAGGEPADDVTVLAVHRAAALDAQPGRR